MGLTQSVYMANGSPHKIWVFIGLQPEWAILDVLQNAAPIVQAAVHFRPMSSNPVLSPTLLKGCNTFC